MDQDGNNSRVCLTCNMATFPESMSNQHLSHITVSLNALNAIKNKYASRLDTSFPFEPSALKREISDFFEIKSFEYDGLQYSLIESLKPLIKDEYLDKMPWATVFNWMHIDKIERNKITISNEINSLVDRNISRHLKASHQQKENKTLLSEDIQVNEDASLFAIVGVGKGYLIYNAFISPSTELEQKIRKHYLSVRYYSCISLEVI